MTSLESGYYSKVYYDYKDIKEALESEEDLINQIGLNDLYCDEEFPPIGESLYVDALRPPKGALSPENFDWLRICKKEIVGCYRPKFIPSEKDIDTNKNIEAARSLFQGALGNLWLVNALTTLAVDKNFSAFKNLLVSDKYANRGLYTFRIYKNNKWRYLHIDDRIPCTRSGLPYFTYCKDNNYTYAMLLEKVYAKLHGCYENLTGGRIEEGLKDLTTTTVMAINMNELQGEKGIPEANKEGPLFDLLNKCITNKYIMSASLNRIKDKDMSTSTGLLPTHAYPIIGFDSFYAPPTELLDGQQVSLLTIKLPWAEGGKLKGNWSYSDKEKWTNHPQFKERIYGKDEDINLNEVGVSFDTITIEDFFMRFDTLYISSKIETSSKNVPLGSMALYKGRWVPGDDKSDSGSLPLYKSFASNPQYTFKVIQGMTDISINLSQKDNRWQEPVSTIPIAYHPKKDAIGFFIMKLDGIKKRIATYSTMKCVGRTPNWSPSRFVGTFVTLPVGRYSIIPCTYVPLDVPSDFLLEIQSNKEIQIEQPDGYPAALDEEATSNDDGEKDKKEKKAAPGEKVSEKNFPLTISTVNFEDCEDKIYQSLQKQVGELCQKIFDLQKSVNRIEENIANSNERK